MLTRNKPLQPKGLFKQRKPLARRKRVRATADELRHIARVAAMPCLVSGEQATVHHVTASIHGGRLSRSHKRIVPPAPRYHQIIHDPLVSDPQSVERLSHAGFFEKHGIDLLAEADRLWREAQNA